MNPALLLYLLSGPLCLLKPPRTLDWHSRPWSFLEMWSQNNIRLMDYYFMHEQKVIRLKEKHVFLISHGIICHSRPHSSVGVRLFISWEFSDFQKRAQHWRCCGTKGGTEDAEVTRSIRVGGILQFFLKLWPLLLRTWSVYLSLHKWA